MENQEIKFLKVNESYQLPVKVLKEHYHYQQVFAEYQVELEDVLIQTYKRIEKIGRENEYGCGTVAGLIPNVENKLIEIAEKVIKMSTQLGIYTITRNRLIDNNEAYQLLKKLEIQTNKTLSAIGDEIQELYDSALVELQEDADNQVTGLNFNVYTNNLISAIAYTSADESARKRQYSKAQKTYQKQKEFLSDKTKTLGKQYRQSEVAEKFYPNLKEAAHLCVIYMMSIFLSELNNKNNFNEDVVNFFNADESCEILNNLKYAETQSQKEDILTEAFLRCPYNLDVYDIIIKDKMFNSQIANAANELGLNKEISVKLMSYCREHKATESNSLYFRTCLQGLSYLEHISVKTKFKELFSEEIRYTKLRYIDLRNGIENQKDLFKWIKTYFAKSKFELCNIKEQDLRIELLRAINGERIIKDGNISAHILFENGNFPLENVSIKGKPLPKSVDELNNQYIEEVLPKIQDLIHLNAVDAERCQKIMYLTQEKINGLIKIQRKDIDCLVAERKAAVGKVYEQEDYYNKLKAATEVNNCDNALQDFVTQTQIKNLKYYYSQLKHWQETFDLNPIPKYEEKYTAPPKCDKECHYLKTVKEERRLVLAEIKKWCLVVGIGITVGVCVLLFGRIMINAL